MSGCTRCTCAAALHHCPELTKVTGCRAKARSPALQQYLHLSHGWQCPHLEDDARVVVSVRPQQGIYHHLQRSGLHSVQATGDDQGRACAPLAPEHP